MRLVGLCLLHSVCAFPLIDRVQCESTFHQSNRKPWVLVMHKLRREFTEDPPRSPQIQTLKLPQQLYCSALYSCSFGHFKTIMASRRLAKWLLALSNSNNVAC